MGNVHPVAMQAYEIGGEVASTLFKADQASAPDPVDLAYIGEHQLQTLPPPYEPGFLCTLYEHSNSLRQNVDAYKTNIDGFGHTLDPVIKLRESGARDIVADSILVERSRGRLDYDPADVPTEAEIDTKIEEIRYRMRLERARAISFFDNCVADESFVSLRRKTREDLEVTGNGYWEVIRNDAGIISQFAYMPARSVRVTRNKSPLLNVEQQVRIGPFAFAKDTYRRKFRRYVQIGGERPVYFREYGDPSIISDRSGKSYETPELLQREEPGAVPANEVLHFKIHSIKNGVYGVPRWIGNLLSVLGSRSAEEVNLAYFDNKSIPPMAILVSGGRLGTESVRRLQDWVEVNIKGKKNFHKILVIEAESSAGSIGLQDNASSMKIEIKQLTDALLKDGLFLEYDAANLDKVGMGFRMPRLLRGDIRDFNRASAQSAIDFAESQVFSPERNDFDFLINRFILPELGIHLWRFKSLGPRLSDSQDLGDMIAKFTTAGILTPQDARELAGEKVLDQELPQVDADWVKQPLALTIAGVPLDTEVDDLIPVQGQPSETPKGNGVEPDPKLIEAAKKRLMGKAKQLIQLRDAMREVQARDALEGFKQQRLSENAAPAEDESLVIKMSREEMVEKFGIET